MKKTKKNLMINLIICKMKKKWKMRIKINLFMIEIIKSLIKYKILFHLEKIIKILQRIQAKYL
jgi:hypothetical protein